MRQTVAVVVLGAVVLGAALFLRETFMSRPEKLPADSEAVLVVEGEVRTAPGTTSAADAVRALVGACQLEVFGDVVTEEQLAADRFRFVLRPALDRGDKVQLRGCLEDWTLDHVQARVLRLERIR